MISIYWNNGIIIKINDFEIILDPITNVNKNSSIFISHAHKDHIYGLLNEYCLKYSTPQTIAIGEVLINKKIKNIVPCNYGESIKFHNLELQLINSGHVFGSAALIIRSKDVTLLYTGDFNFTKTLIQEAISPIECDIMIVEATYGKPGMVFPPREEVYLDIISWVAKTINNGFLPILLVYPLGKAQEITKLFNKFSSIPVVTHPKISKINEVVRNFGENLIFYDLNEDGKELVDSRDCVVLFPFSYNTNRLRIKYPNSKIGIVTGWAILYKNIKNADISFPLSSHADYPQLINFISKCNPKKVFTVYGYTKELARSLRKIGIDARSII
ncbi:MAG: MBL fold metallo-hydrolase [Candidatus Verstraetearchaeota archaeon]|nr:MBL fold metallo-hydrolase [Candidatus Verstraetearchaeota archaeon]